MHTSLSRDTQMKGLSVRQDGIGYGCMVDEIEIVQVGQLMTASRSAQTGTYVSDRQTDRRAGRQAGRQAYHVQCQICTYRICNR
mmetsp:Transcript_35171/g.101121  ORF Transcript_35171/g.101121 Transcript_35171/m.101121 type:complete len:84 (-) Transcript_35171:617-868(-)